MDYYSVDRRKVYVEGQLIVPEPGNEPNDNRIVAHINTMYPQGFSRHGVRYFRDALPDRPFVDKPDYMAFACSEDYLSGIIELLLEATRKAHYPDKPCRYQSMFACASIEEAIEFRNTNGTQEDPIHALHPQAKVHRGDMSIYSVHGTFASIDHRLHLYWQGETLDLPNYAPKWEYVLELPVLVGTRVL